MPPADDIQRQMTGSWRMMMGKPDGLRLLDISPDGFWNSFFAIVVAAPALALGWVAVANELAMRPAAASRFAYVAGLALADLATWLLPLVALAFAARPLGIADRFTHYVVASNWGAAVVVWLMLPASLLRIFSIGGDDLAAAISLGFFLFSLLLFWRLTRIAINRDTGTVAAVFGGMLVASFLVLFTLQGLLGIAP